MYASSKWFVGPVESFAPNVTRKRERWPLLEMKSVSRYLHGMTTPQDYVEKIMKKWQKFESR